MDKLAVILVGGRGSRLGSITDNMPKPLVEVRGKPIIWYTFLNLYHHGFRRFVFPLGYKGEMIEKYIKDAFNHLNGVVAWFVKTGDDSPIAKRMSKIRGYIPMGEDFFLVNGDTLFDFDINEMYQKHKDENALVTLSSVEVVAPWGVIIYHGLSGKIVGFDRSRRIRHVEGVFYSKGLINSGLAWINKDALDLIDLDTCGDFETSLYQKVIQVGSCSHYEIKGMWYPIDTQKDLENINREMGE